MYSSLNPRMLQLSLSMDETIDAARVYGFDGVEIDIRSFDETPPERLRARIQDAGLRAGGWTLPLDFAADAPTFREGLRRLPTHAKPAAALGAKRCVRWVQPFSDELSWNENWSLHADRLRTVSTVLEEHGCRLGLEFVGPLTSRQGHRYEFIHTAEQMLALCEEAGPNVGLLLDSWHWYTSGGDVADLVGLNNDNVVLVHVNDAPAGRARDEQIDRERLLPATTGVIDIRAFMDELRRMDYDGPIVVEPFDSSLASHEPSARLRATADALRAVMSGRGQQVAGDSD